MIYGDCNRASWQATITGIKFFSTALVLGIALVLVTSVAGGIWDGIWEADARVRSWLARLALALAGATAAKLGWEATAFRHLMSRAATVQKRVALLLTSELRGAAQLRFATGLFGGVVLPLFLAHLSTSALPVHPAVLIFLVLLIFALTLIGEFSERYLFFTSATRDRMPGL
jgi:DMSO reductase anchor subunit